MSYQFLTNYTSVTFLEKIKDNLRKCKAFSFSVSFIKKAGLVMLFKDIEAAVERGAKGRIITSTYQNFTDIESLKSFLFFSLNILIFSVTWIMNVSMTIIIQRLVIIQKDIFLSLMNAMK